MVYTMTISSKGRFTVPIKIRRELGFDKVKKVLMDIKDNKIIVRPLKNS